MHTSPTGRGGAGRGGGCGPAERYGAVVDNAARLTVIGSLNMDISVTVPSLPGPGATVLGRAAVFAPGGKGANQAVAAARLGGEGLSVAMIGCTGDDDFGRTLRAALRAEGVDDSAVRTAAGVPTGIAMITVDQAGENIITVAPGANAELSVADVTDAAAASSAAGANREVSVADVTDAAAASSTAGAEPERTVPDLARPAAASSSGKRAASAVLVISAEVPVPAISAALAASAGRALRVLNLAPAPPEAAELVAAGPDWLVVNESEAAAVLGRPVSGLTEAAAAAADLVAAGAVNAVVTAGAAGAAYCGPENADDRPGPQTGDDRPGPPAAVDGPLGPQTAAGHGLREADGGGHSAGAGDGKPVVVTVPGFKVQATDTVGAGDTFVGALAVALAAGIGPVDAVTAASAAGATAATRPGTQSGMPRPADVLAVTGHRWPLP